MKVCSLSRGVMFQHLSNPLQTGIRFFPSSHTRYTIGSPCGYLPVYHGSISGLPCSVCVTTDDLGLALFTGDRFVHDRRAGQLLYRVTIPFWVKPDSIFGLFYITVFIKRSLVLAISSHSSPYPPDAGRNTLASQFGCPAMSDGRIHCQRAI